MASSINDINILITAKDMATAVIAKSVEATKAMSAELNASSAASREAGNAMSGSLIPGINGFTLTAAAVGATIGYAIHKAGDFQQQLTKLVTSAGESQQNLTLVGDGIKKLAVETGESTSALADGMYKVSSAGFHGAEGLTVLKAAEQGAKAEGADLQTVADAVSSSLIDYHLKAGDAADVTSKLVAATAAGKMRFEELAGAMPAILPIASAAHVSLSDILGDMASMTVHGMSAEQSAQNLADTIRHMVNPTAQQAKELAMLNMTTTQLAGDLQSKGLSGTLQEISTKIMNLMPPGADKVVLNLKTALNGLPDQVKELGAHLFDGSMSMKEYSKAAAALDPIAAKQAISFATLAGATHRIGDQQLSGAQVMQNYTQALAKATGDSTGLNVALMLTGENADYTNAAIKSVASATTEAGGNVKGWAEIQNNFNTTWSRFVQSMNVGAISLGQVLLPAASAVLDGILKMNEAIGASTKYLIDHGNQVAIAAGVLTVLFGPALIGVAAKATIAGATSVASAIQSAAAWVASGAKMSLAWELNAAKVIGQGIAVAASAVAQAARSTAAWIASAAETSTAWVASAVSSSAAWLRELPKIVLEGSITALKSTVHAVDIALAWTFNALRVGIVWTEQMAIVVAKGAWATAMATPQAIMTSVAWIKSAAASSYAWVTVELPKIVLGWIDTARAAAIHAAVSSASWVKNAAVASFAWVTVELPKIITGFITTSTAATVQGALSSAAWVKNAAIASTAWVITELPKIIQSFIAVAGASIVQAGIATGAWVTAAATSSAAFNSLAALVATPLVMPAIAVGAAIAALVLVQNAANQAKAAIDGAMAATQQEGDESVALIKNARKQYESGQISEAKFHQLLAIYSKPTNAQALGTNFAPGGLTMVGENGPELVAMPTGSKVYNARETSQMMSGGNGVTINMGGVTIANQMDKDKFLRDLGWRLAMR